MIIFFNQTFGAYSIFVPFYNYYKIMSFFSKGDFKIQESWNPDKSKDPRPNKSRNSQRNSSLNTNNNQSLMRQLADSLAQPSTDVIDDSLSKLLMKQREQHYGGIPKPKKQTQDVNYKKTPTLEQNKKVQSNNDSDLVSSMANRLQKLQKTCQSQRQQIKQQKETIQKIKTENAFLKGMKEDSSKAYEQMKELKSRNEELQKKVVQMEGYLKQYGLKWVGNKIEGKLNDKAIKKQISQSKYAYRLPSQIDIGTIKRRVAELNAGIQAEGMGTQIYNEKGVHKFRKAESLPIGFYSNGIVVKGYNFYPYKSKESLKILADLIDGYFPFIFKAKFPNGVLLQVVDHIEQAYTQEKKQEKVIGSIGGSDRDFEPMSKEQFLNKLPNQVIKNGKVIPVRGQIEKLFNGNNEQNKKNSEENSFLVEVQGVFQLKTTCWSAIANGKHSNEQSCCLKIRLQNGSIYLVKMFKGDKVIDIMTQLRKVIKNKIQLATNFPKRVYNGDQKEDLQELGFYPNENLHIIPVK